jgi:hypothetical protein
MQSKTTKRKLLTTVSPATAAMYELLSDGQLHELEDVLKAGAIGILAADYARCIEEGKRARHHRDALLIEYAKSGARAIARNNLMIAKRNGKVNITKRKTQPDLVRMPVAYAREWRRKTKEQSNQPGIQGQQVFGKITSYAGITEWEGWSYAPLVSKDVVHVRPTTPIPMSVLIDAFPGWEISESPEGLVTISALSGAPVKEVVAEWFNTNNIYHEGVRDAKNVRRRDLGQLPKPFFEDLMRSSTSFARGLVASRHGAAMQKLVGDNDDIDGYVAQWVLELASAFDPSLGTPFGAWLTKQLPRKIQDLGRAQHGRTAADAEILYSRAVQEYETTYGKTPSSEELRKLLKLSREEFRAKTKHLQTLQNLRSTTTIDVDPDQPEVAIEDLKPKPEDIALAREKSQQITLALLAASGKIKEGEDLPTMTMPLGFLVTYLMHWDDWVKGDLIHLAGCADRKVTEELDKVNSELSKILREYKGD